MTRVRMSCLSPRFGSHPSSQWRVSPRADDHRRFSWKGGEFETATRRHTPEVEGSIRSDCHLIMVTLGGGARLHEFTTDEGFRFRGEDRRGSASFLPAGCERRLVLRDVSWEWASISLPSDATLELPKKPVSYEMDAFLSGLLAQFRDLHQADGALDPIYCDTMKLALVHYLRNRDRAGALAPKRSGGLTPRQLRLVADFVDANLGTEIRIADLSLLVGLSDGYFHRAFRKTTGGTPLHYVNSRRVARGAELLMGTNWSVTTIALEVGFLGSSHFARTFRAVRGISPAAYRRMS